MCSSKFRLLLLLSFIVFFHSGFRHAVAKVSSQEILLKSRNAILKVKTIHYTCHFMQKFAGGNDTLKTNANLYLEIKNNDSLMGCNMKMTGEFRFYAMSFKTELYYTAKKNITLNHTKKKATVDTTGSRGKAKPVKTLLKQNFPTADLLNHYTEKTPYALLLAKQTKVNMQKDEKIGMYTCYKLEITSKDSDGKKRVSILFIDKASLLPVRRIDWLDLDNKLQYSDFTLSDILVNSAQTSLQIQEPLIPKGYEVEHFRSDRY